MPNSAVRFSFSALVVLGMFLNAASQTPPKAMRASEVIALQAGGVLPESVAHDIAVRGLNFQPDEDFRTLMKTTGADATVLAALKAAKVTAPASDGKPDKELLKQLSTALVLIRDKRYDEAGTVLSRALESSFAGPETGFVMGEALRRKEEFRQAAEVYAEVLHQDPDFPEVHTKVSYVLYRLGASEDALQKRRPHWPRIRTTPRLTRMPGSLWATNRDLRRPRPSIKRRCESSPTMPACTTTSGSSFTTCTTTKTQS